MNRRILFEDIIFNCEHPNFRKTSGKWRKFSEEQVQFLEDLSNAPTFEKFRADGALEKTLVDYNDKDLLVQCMRQCFHDPKKFWPLLENAQQLVHNSKFEDYKLADFFR